jgi:hypothetical protein
MTPDGVCTSAHYGLAETLGVPLVALTTGSICGPEVPRIGVEGTRASRLGQTRRRPLVGAGLIVRRRIATVTDDAARGVLNLPSELRDLVRHFTDGDGLYPRMTIDAARPAVTAANKKLHHNPQASLTKKSPNRSAAGHEPRRGHAAGG